VIDFVNAARVPDLIRLCESRGISCEWYIFGSVAAGGRSPSDIDVLLICDDEHSLDSVQDEVKEYLLRAPIHLVVMTSQEERDLNFREVVSAVAFRTS
jgi:predicted nucleotidyltransferase